MPGEVGKVDLIHLLAGRYGYRRFLEISTPHTGFFYGAVDRGRFDDCRRLGYKWPAGYSDGFGVDYRSETLDIRPALAAIAAEGRRFDIIFIDPFHTYEASIEPIRAAFAMLPPGGAMVVHDCQPPSEDVAGPEFKAGLWCGVTYKAWLDFVVGRSDIRYVTVATDLGCGIVLKKGARLRTRIRNAFGERARQIAAWRAVGANDYAAAWRTYAENQGLLRLVPPEAFIERNLGLGPAPAQRDAAAGA